jgi:hypothetical protein
MKPKIPAGWRRLRSYAVMRKGDKVWSATLHEWLTILKPIFGKVGELVVIRRAARRGRK